MNELEDLFIHISKKGFSYAILSSPLEGDITKIAIKPIEAQNEVLYQLTQFKNNQAFHQNYSLEAILEVIKKDLENFKQALFCFDEFDIHILRSKKGKVTLLKKPPSKSLKILPHNRVKQYILEEGRPIPFLVELGIMDQKGKVYPKKQDKFRQLNRFLEMVRDVLPYLKNLKKRIRILDFGCGKAYLTFALYYYLQQENIPFEMVGLDLKKEVIAFCEDLKKRLKMDYLHFICSDINNYSTENKLDMMISLHACDTATDAALEKAIHWKAGVILSVPCCQHELFTQVKSGTLKPLLEHGLFKERFSALITDALRAKILEILGYQVQVLEFIDLEHTPKNLLIRAIKKHKTYSKEELLKEYQTLKNFLQVTPSLEKRFSKELNP